MKDKKILGEVPVIQKGADGVGRTHWVPPARPVTQDDVDAVRHLYSVFDYGSSLGRVLAAAETILVQTNKTQEKAITRREALYMAWRSGLDYPDKDNDDAFEEWLESEKGRRALGLLEEKQ